MKMNEALPLIREHLGPEWLRKDWLARRPIDAVASWGCCYVACEALAHLVNVHRYRPASVRVGDVIHWYLIDTSTGNVVDPTADQFDSLPDYDQGRRRGFLTTNPSKRAQKLLEKVNN